MSTAEIIPWDAEQRNVLHALTRKRAEIAGLADEAKRSLDSLIVELEHVDATIRLFSPALDIAQIKPKQVARAVVLKGEMSRPVFRMLRDADHPLTPREITLGLLEARGLNPEDRQLVAILIKRVRACLREHKCRGLIDSVPMVGGQQGWEIVR